jgi:hypothetical protein
MRAKKSIKNIMDMKFEENKPVSPIKRINPQSFISSGPNSFNEYELKLKDNNPLLIADEILSMESLVL